MEFGNINQAELISLEGNALTLAFAEGEEVVAELPSEELAPEVGNSYDFFIWKDLDGKIWATRKKPLVKSGEFAIMQVLNKFEELVELDWGLSVPLVVPVEEQHDKLHQNAEYLFFISNDDRGRIYASSKVEDYVQAQCQELEKEDEVDILLVKETDLGIKVIVNDTYWGLIYNNDIFTPDLYQGLRRKAFVKLVREDGRLDITLQKNKWQSIPDNVERILAYLEENDGKMELTDKSDPEAIYEVLEISKKAFKRALGTLYRERKIELDKDSTRLVK